ncbi:hypothetical protein PsorP6_002935 [Peronosclerospora sorghi]|uniref:Uncharacterized protein n=1 Tax=Peronosclerospora sorghi TaxID=230839 RepID=A0ACC0VIM9_9STRA|nr:hypothetical protein PsorP6_002935 [Peronosclerospora sorghi]
MWSMDVSDENVVGTLFLQHGEDNGYDPEYYVLEINVGASAPPFRISVADDDGGIPASLFACSVWNGARFLSMYISRQPQLVRGHTVVEFGAASALPSLVALHFGATVAVMTDYPNELLLKNIELNIRRNEHLLGDGRREVRGHLWGSETTDILKCLETPSPNTKPVASSDATIAPVASSTQFDIAIVAECLWLHHLHEQLLESITSCLAPHGKVLVSFAHHVPGHEQNDLSFFTKAKTLYGYNAIHVDTLSSPHIFNAEVMVDQYLYVLSRNSLT